MTSFHEKEGAVPSPSTVPLWLIWAIVTFFYAYQYVLRVMPSILMEDIVKKFALSPQAFGQFSGVYYLGYSLMHLPIGILLDRFSPKRVLPVLIACTSLGLLPILYADSLVYPIVGRVLIGVGSSGAILGIFKVLHMFFDPLKFSRYLSFSVTIGLLGAIYGGRPVYMARQSFGFESLVFALIVVSLVLATCTYFILPPPTSRNKEAPLRENLRNVMFNKELLLLCLIAGLMVGPLEGFADVWGVQFLKIFHAVPEASAAGLPSWIFVGMCIGGPVLSFLAEKRQNYAQVVFGCSFVMALAFALLLSVQMSTVQLSVLFFVVGLASAYQMLMIYHISTLFASESRKNLSSVVSNMMIMIFGYVFHSGIGKSVAWFNTNPTVDPFQNAESLVAGIALIPVALVLACLSFAGYFFWRQGKFKAVQA